MVDQFSDHSGSAVLLAQIEAGGVGLNIQATSVVILAEPQWNPSTEAQAVASGGDGGMAPTEEELARADTGGWPVHERRA
ncbi:hypothetical protein GS485_24910 [Rhodococcus hoagii]|nr:hypothetical protein [Prescottella equi]NKR70015.1 hypothetical protein [Prescottella equi]NKT07251.1 hypothetical protein [Prescottella equi]